MMDAAVEIADQPSPFSYFFIHPDYEVKYKVRSSKDPSRSC